MFCHSGFGPTVYDFLFPCGGQRTFEDFEDDYIFIRLTLSLWQYIILIEKTNSVYIEKERQWDERLRAYAWTWGKSRLLHLGLLHYRKAWRDGKQCGWGIVRQTFLKIISAFYVLNRNWTENYQMTNFNAFWPHTYSYFLAHVNIAQTGGKSKTLILWVCDLRILLGK